MIRKKLVIISHTEHYLDKEGVIKGWGSTINEINFLADHWEEIEHIACLYQESPPLSALPYLKKNICFTPIPPFGGKGLLNKLKIIGVLPRLFRKIYSACSNATEVQLRLPTSIGIFLLPFFTFLLPRKFTLWIKYAGNWGQLNPPFSYKIQRKWLKNNWANCKVTLNGFWKDQSFHCISFENPCLTDEEILLGKKLTQNKNYNPPFVLVFVGRLDDAKGVPTIIEALKLMPLESIAEVHFVGDGSQIDLYKNSCLFLGDKVFFHGFLAKNDVHEILKKSHFLLLPSKSEGFPKVIAEGACYGVIPIVSEVGSIGHYINNSNGFVWNLAGNTSYDEILHNAFNFSASNLKQLAFNGNELAEKFTFTHYIKKLNELILRT